MNTSIPPLVFEDSHPGRRAVRVPGRDVPEAPLPKGLLRSEALDLPELSELDVVRHYTRLSQLNFAIDANFYPLGSCTMKYNPKMNERLAALAGFAEHHPEAPEEYSQGSLELMYRLQEAIAEIAGFAGVSLQPAAGAQGELAGVLMIRAYHRSRGDEARTRILLPDSAHGTNPASAVMAGFEAVELPSDSRGNVDLAALKAACDERTAGLMITNPNTLGLFEEQIEEVVATVHGAGGLVYGDGANMNAILGAVRPGDLGIDVMHFNLHKTFSTPHGGGGPGAGPVGVAERLVAFLPGPIVAAAGTDAAGGAGPYRWHMPPASIGRLKSFAGNFGMLVRAYAYILAHGAEGLAAIGQNAVLNANYLRSLLKTSFPARYDRTCMHEFVSRGDVAPGITTMDVAKRLLDYGFHAPTVYFPLIVKEALMIEPTESESRETLEAFAGALEAIAREAATDPDLLHQAPHSMPLRRLDEVRAAKDLKLTWRTPAGG